MFLDKGSLCVDCRRDVVRKVEKWSRVGVGVLTYIVTDDFVCTVGLRESQGRRGAGGNDGAKVLDVGVTSGSEMKGSVPRGMLDVIVGSGWWECGGDESAGRCRRGEGKRCAREGRGIPDAQKAKKKRLLLTGMCDARCDCVA